MIVQTKEVPMFNYLKNLMNPKKIINYFLKILLIKMNTNIRIEIKLEKKFAGLPTSPFKNPIGLLNFGEESDESLIDLDEHQEYNLGDRSEVFSKLCINLGT